MINVGYRVINGDLVRKGLEKLRRKVPLIARDRIYKSLVNVSRRMRTETPAPVPEYARTSRYELGWGRPFKVGENAYMLENTVEYAVYVVGNLLGEQQAEQNRHWIPFRNVVEDEVSKLPKKVEESIQVYTSAYGL